MVDGNNDVSLVTADAPDEALQWPLSDLLAAIAVLVMWRCSPYLFRETLAGLPGWAQGTFSLFGPQLFYLFFPIGMLWLRGVRGVFQWPTRRQLLTEAAISLAVLGAIVAITGVILGLCTLFLPDFSIVSIVPATYTRRAATWSAQVVWFLLLFSVVVAPVCEEVFFRGFLHQSLRTRMSTPVAGAIQSLCFALMHGLDPILTPASFVVGVVLTVMYQWRKSLLSSIFLHSGLNVVSALVFLSMTTGIPDRPVLGVAGQDHSDGCVVTYVMQGSPAATASLLPGDVIKTFGGQRVRGFTHLVDLVRSSKLGNRVTLQIRRDGAPMELHVILLSASPPVP